MKEKLRRYKKKYYQLPDEQKDMICDACEKNETCVAAYTREFYKKGCAYAYSQIKDDLELDDEDDYEDEAYL